MACKILDDRDRQVAKGFRLLNDVVEPTVRGGIGGPLPLGVGLVILETVGRKSGLPRTVPLLANRLGSTLVVSTVRRSSQWIRNLKANPEVTVWVNGKQRAAIGKIISDAPLTIVSLTLS